MDKKEKKLNIGPTIITLVLIVTILVSATILYNLFTKPEEDVPKSSENTVLTDTDTNDKTVVVDSVEYKTETDELSFENTERNLTLTQYFERIVITDEGENFDKINAYIKKLSDNFISDAQENEAFVVDEEHTTYMMYTNIHQAEITKNSDGILSIKMTAVYYMGGTDTIDTYGLNFDLNTGELLAIETFLGMSKTDAKEYLAEESKKQITEEFNDDAEKIIDEYELENFNFYILKEAASGDQLYICYPQHKIAPGAAGAIIMEIPIPTTNE